MTDNTTTTPSDTVTQRFDRSTPSLSPDVRSIAFDSLEPLDRSVPVALCRTSADLFSNAEPSDRVLEGVTVAIGALEGYVSLRTGLLREGTFQSQECRDMAILAGDYLHAFAHASIGNLAAESSDHLELFRVLTRGSNALARAFAKDDRDGELSDDWSDPQAVLGGVASALGVATAGGDEPVREAMRTYGYWLTLALTTVSCGEPTRSSPQSMAVRILSADAPSPQSDPETTDPGADGGGRGETVDRLLARALTSLESLSQIEGADSQLTTGSVNGSSRSTAARQRGRTEQARVADETTESDHANPGPYERLERATWVPFVDVSVTDE